MNRIYSNEQIAAALANEKNLTLTAVCSEVGCSRGLLRARIQTHPELSRLAAKLATRKRDQRAQARQRDRYAAIDAAEAAAREVSERSPGWSYVETYNKVNELRRKTRRSNRAKLALGFATRRLTYRRSC